MKIICVILLLSCFTGFKSVAKNEVYNILILSGSNNHNWQKTTPFLKSILEKYILFNVSISNEPGTLIYENYKKYDAIVSNWNSWPNNKVRWSESAEEGLLKYMEKGGGLVFFHSSTSAFYEWPYFKEISIGAWGDSTWHGPNSPVKVEITDQQHPITNGLSEFYVFDELWVDAEFNNSFEVLGTAMNKELQDKKISSQPAIFTLKHKKGRVFHTILGHDTRAMRNTGFQTLILRATEWAATSEVNIPIPFELQKARNNREQTFSWLENDSTFALHQNGQAVWQFNYNTKLGKPFFHPIFVKKNNLTCVSPSDHKWHLGQWFSWKYINGKNYWEYIRNSYESEGITEITDVSFQKDSDTSAKIKLSIEYHPKNEESILSENRSIEISKLKNGNIQMDYELNFTALADSVILDRTPIIGEPNGKSWGGYAGLSIRFNQDFTNSRFLSGIKEEGNFNGKPTEWVYIGFDGFDGNQVGSVIMISQETKREGEAWYAINTEELPFYYLSPAYLYLKPLTLEKGKQLNLKYRVLHIGGEVSKEELNNEYENYKNNQL